MSPPSRRAVASRALVLVVATTVGTLVTTTSTARASDETAGVELFERGKAAANRHDWAGACPMFAESFRLLPKVGSVLNLADCEEQLGKLAEARSHWQQGIDLARSTGDARRADFAAQRLSRLDTRVPRLTLRLAPGAPPDTTVSRDGVDVGAASLGVGMPVDPGAHTIVTSAPGRAKHAQDVSLKEGEARTLVVAPGDALPAAAAQTPEGATASESSSSTWSGRRTAALVLGGVGVVGLGIGTFFGLTTASKKSDANGHCDASLACDATGVQLLHDAHVDGDVSTAAFIVGGVALAVGAVLWFTAPGAETGTARATAPSIGLAPNGVLLRGAW